MSDQVFSANFSIPSSARKDSCLLLEQEPWGKDVGETSELQGIQAITAAINTIRWPEVNCGGLNAEFNATFYVYPCSLITVYRFKVSHGKVSARTVELAYRDEIVQCSMKLEHDLDYPVHSIGLVAWIGKCYDSKGNLTSRPIVSIENGHITLSKKVYASLRVRYVVMRHIYHVTVSERLQAIENTYQSVAYVVWNGGVKWLDVQAPANFEEFAGDCGNGAFYDPYLQNGYLDGQLSQTKICGPSYYSIPVAVEADRKVTVDYCSQTVLSDTTSEKVDYESQKAECND